MTLGCDEQCVEKDKELENGQKQPHKTTVYAHGISGFSGRHGLHKEPWIDHILGLNVYKTLFSAERLRQYREETACPNCDKVCQELVMLWASGPLLGSISDMNDVTNALFKVYENRDKLHLVE